MFFFNVIDFFCKKNTTRPQKVVLIVSISNDLGQAIYIDLSVY